MSVELVTNSNYGRRQLFSDSFTLLGAGAAIPTPSATDRHAESYTLVDDGAGILGYRVRLRAGQIGYDMTLPTSSIKPAIKVDNATGHAVSGARVNDAASSLGLPKANEFDLVIRTMAGAVVQTSGLQVSWDVTVLDRG